MKDEYLTFWGYKLGTVEAEEAWIAKQNMTTRTAPTLILDIQPWESYESPASGKLISSKAQRREDMKMTGSRQYEGREQELKEAARQSAYAEQKEDAKLDRTVRTAWAQLSPEKKERAMREINGSH
jgi:hypothetical protein